MLKLFVKGPKFLFGSQKKLLRGYSQKSFKATVKPLENISERIATAVTGAQVSDYRHVQGTRHLRRSLVTNFVLFSILV